MARPVFSKAFSVGLLVALVGLAFLIAFTFFRKGGYGERDSYVVFAYFDDVTGLTWKSRVQIAGVQVGEVEKVTLAGTRARLDLRIQKDIDVREDACLTKRFPSSLLPDALIELVPGSTAVPSLRDEPPEQREVRCVREAVSVAKLLESLSKVTADIQVLSSDLAQTVGGTQGSIRQIIENLSRVSRSIERTIDENGVRVAAIMKNAQDFTGELSDITQKDRERYRTITRNIETASEQLKNVLASVQDILGSNQPQFKESVAGLRQALEKVNQSLDQVGTVATRISEGKGVAGKLLADERLGERLSRTVEGVSDYVDRLVKLQVELNLRSEWLYNQTGAKTYFGMKLLPRPDKYYMVEIVNDPRGVDTVTSETVTTDSPVRQTTVTSRTVHEQKLLFSLQFAKRYGPMTFRVGVIESSGGAGADLHLFDDHLELSVSAYQFSRPYTDVFPRAKVWANYNFLKHFYLTAGADDFLNTWRAGHYPGGPKFSLGSDVFFGGGLYFTDDDLKAILSTVGGAAGSAVK